MGMHTERFIRSVHKGLKTGKWEAYSDWIGEYSSFSYHSGYCPFSGPVPDGIVNYLIELFREPMFH